VSDGPRDLQDSQSDGPQEHGALLRRNALSYFGNVGVALGSVGPTVSIAVTLAALVVVTGYATPLAVLISAIPMLAIAYAFRQLNRWRVTCGATYEWGGRTVSPYFGWIIGWTIMFAYVLSVVPLSLGPYVFELIGKPNSRILDAVVGFALIVVATVCAYLGITLTARVQWLLIIIEYIGAILLGIICLFALAGHHHGFYASFSWSWFSWKSMGGIHGFVGAALIAVFLYSGWDTGILVNEETRDSRETPGRSVMTTVWITAIIFVFLTFAYQGAVSPAELSSHGDALAYIAQVISGSVLAKYMVLAVALSTIGATLASMIATTRVMFAMGADGVLPTSFSRTSVRYKTPWVATLVVAIVATIIVWVYALSSSSVVTAFQALVSISGLLYGVYYIGTGISAMFYFRRIAFTTVGYFIRLLLIPLAASAFLFYILIESVPGLGGWGSEVLLSFYGMMGVGVLIMIYVRIRERAPFWELTRETFAPPQDAATPLAGDSLRGSA
jgi:amino acid transporter